MGINPLFTYQAKFSSGIIRRIRLILWVAVAMMVLAAVVMPRVFNEETGALSVFFIVMAAINTVMSFAIPIYMKKLDAHLYLFYEDRVEVFMKDQPLYEIAYKDVASVSKADVSLKDAVRGLDTVRLNFARPLALMKKSDPCEWLDMSGLPAAEMPHARIQEIVEKKRRA